MTTTNVTAGELGERLTTDDAPVLLDVRTPAEFQSARMPGAVNVPLDTLRRQRHEARAVAEQAPPVVVVCQSGGRARDAAKVLGDAGLPSVEVLDGGLAQWRRSGGEVEQGRGAWEMERQVRLVAGGLVLASVLTSTVLPRSKWLAGGIGGGLTFAALSDTCAMGAALAKAPWNRGDTASSLGAALQR